MDYTDYKLRMRSRLVGGDSPGLAHIMVCEGDLDYHTEAQMNIFYHMFVEESAKANREATLDALMWIICVSLWGLDLALAIS